MLISLIAILPIVTLIILALFSKQSFLLSAVLSLMVLVVASFFVWEIALVTILASAVKGIFVALEIIIIIFAALLIFGVFTHLGGAKTAKQFFDRISPDYHIKATLIAWAFVAFLEGVSGFGTPAIIAVPILISIGFAPVTSVIISLIGGALPVTFGAVGLPVTYGFAAVLGQNLALEAASLITILNIIMAPIVVAAILFVISKEKNRLQDIWRRSFFIIFAASAVSIPSFITFHLLGPELPSIIGGISGIVLISLYAILQKRKKINNKTVLASQNLMPFMPYITVAVLLSIIKIPFLENFLREIVSINIPSILGTTVSHIFYPLASPAIAFLATATIFFVIFWWKKEHHYAREIILSATGKIGVPSLALISILIFAQIMLHSGINNAGFPNMVEAVANIFYGASATYTAFIAPMIGALGAFITGSSTVSNLLFAPIQQSLAITSGAEEKIIIALQGMGSAAGNMIGITNILIALAVAGIGLKKQSRSLKKDKERREQDILEAENKVIKTNAPFLLIYILFAGALGIIILTSGLI